MGTSNLDRGAVGYLYVDPGTGEVSLGAISDLAIRVDGKQVDHIDVQSYPFGTDLSIWSLISLEIEFTWQEIADITLWAMVLHGASAIQTTTAGTASVANEVHVLSGELWSQFTYGDDIDEDGAITVCASLAGADPYTLTSDYFVDRRSGAVCRVDGGSIADGASVYVNYVKNTYVGKYFSPFVDSAPDQYAVRLVKQLLMPGGTAQNLRVRHTKAQFDSTAELPLAPGTEGEWVGVKSKIKFLKDVGGTYGTYGRWEIYTP
jgi:hypothetical protein